MFLSRFIHPIPTFAYMRALLYNPAFSISYHLFPIFAYMRALLYNPDFIGLSSLSEPNPLDSEDGWAITESEIFDAEKYEEIQANMEK